MAANVGHSGVPAAAGAGMFAAADRGVGRALELLCAVLVVVETLILFVGVIARYVLHTPLVWSDELASTLFLWLGMLGAALAIRRSENLRANIDAIVREHVPDLDESQITERESNQAHFLSITYTITAQSREQIVALATALQASKDVIMLI